MKLIQVQEALALLTTLKPNPPEARIATIDTGVRGTHASLRDNYIGHYGWLDPYLSTSEPNDQVGHGTHTTGTICGTGGNGVYPQAKWMACKGCATSSCSRTALLACAQFIACPTLADGSSPNCSLAPHVVSNSWGGGRGDPWFEYSLQAWQAAGIVPIFSVGNSGPSCLTVGSPADSQVALGVGATLSNDDISSFSSRGPTTDGRLKPDICAPGSDVLSVLSAYHMGDTDYRSLSGTSVSIPHVAALVAVLKAYDNSLEFDKVTEHLFQGAETETLITKGQTCGGIPDNVFPNNVFGYGRINVVKSLIILITAQ